MTTAEVLHERVPGGQDPRRPVTFQAAHRPQPGLQLSVIGLDRKISAVFLISSRRDSRNPAATRVIRRNTNRRHMVSDHHGQTTGRATLLVRAMDEIPGTHRDVAGQCCVGRSVCMDIAH